jgi:hypothetical protein
MVNRCRRLSKDWKCLNRNALAFLCWASLRLMVRRNSVKTQDDLGRALRSMNLTLQQLAERELNAN